MEVLRLTLRQLQIFAAVARAGSTTAASEEIALSQSATSAAINELERLLSLRLFDRMGKRLLLNENGRSLLPRALAVLRGALDIEQMAREPEAQMHSLRIGASTTIGNYALPGMLSQFLGTSARATGPSWHSAVSIGNTEAICEAVAAFELDIGLIEGPCHDPNLAVSPWLQDEMVIVAARGRSGGAPERCTVKMLREQTWLLREPGSGTRETVDQLLLPHLRAYRSSLELGSSEAIKHAVAQGLGLGCLSRWVVQDLLAVRRLREVQTTLPTLTRQWHWVVHKDKQLTAALQRFIALLASPSSAP